MTATVEADVANGGAAIAGALAAGGRLVTILEADRRRDSWPLGHAATSTHLGRSSRFRKTTG